MTYPIHFSLWVFTSSSFKGFFQNYQKNRTKKQKNPRKTEKIQPPVDKIFFPHSTVRNYLL